MDKHTAEWIEYAKRDLESAKYLTTMRPAPFEIICYLCQQSAEKALKSLLIARKRPLLRIHDLTMIQHDLIKIFPKLSEVRDQCIDLADYSANIRYPAPIELLEEDAVKAISDAANILNLIKNILQRDSACATQTAEQETFCE